MIEQASISEVAAAVAPEGDAPMPDAVVYLDVRTVEEFARGHVPGALNVPFVERDPATGAPIPNPDFGAVVEAAVPRSTTIYCGCATGVRSQHAGMMLRQIGFERVVNVIEGFDGQRDAAGRPLATGWKDAGYPIAEGAGDERAYSVLRRRALGDG